MHLLHPLVTTSKDAHEKALTHWKILLEAEEAACAGAVVKPLALMYWRLNPLIRSLFLAFEEDERKGKFFTIESSANSLLMAMAKHIGDSRIIENVHQHGRDIFRASKANSISNIAIMANALRSKVLEERKIQIITGMQSAKAFGPGATFQQKEGVKKALTCSGKKLPKEIQLLMSPKKKDNTWPSPTPAALFPSAAATEWLFNYWQKGQAQNVNSAWLSFLARPGAFVANRSTGSLIKVMASAEFGLLGLLANVERTYDNQKAYTLPYKHRESMQWFHITDLGDWLEVQVAPTLTQGEGTLGPVGWCEKGEPLTLEAAAMIAGYTITYQHMKELIKVIGGDGCLPKGQVPKRQLQELMIDMCVPDEYKELARAHLQDKKDADDEIDTDFSELLSELDKDDNNTQDLKDLKEKRKHHRMKRVLKTKDEMVKPKAKAKGKAKGKAKAKPKPKAKSKSFLNSLIKRAQARLEQEKAEEANRNAEDSLPMDVPMDVHEEEEPFVPEPASASTGPVPEVAIPPEEFDDGPEPPIAAPREPRGRTPDEITNMLSPPGCKIRVGFKDHRFTSSWKMDHSELDAPYSQKTMTATFVTLRGWQDALRRVHAHNWEKWNRVKHIHPLEPGVPEQRPGVIDQEIFDQLQATIDNLGVVKRYPGRKRS